MVPVISWKEQMVVKEKLEHVENHVKERKVKNDQLLSIVVMMFIVFALVCTSLPCMVNTSDKV